MLTVATVALLTTIINQQPLDADFQRAVALWKEFSMPVPTANAKPVYFAFKNDPRKNDPTSVLVGICDGEKLYTGTTIGALDREIYRFTPSEWTSPVLGTCGVDYYAEKFSEDGVIGTIVQSFAMGQSKFAKELLAKISSDSLSFFDTAAFCLPKNQTLSARVAHLIFVRLVNDFCSENSDGNLFLSKLIRLQRHGLLKASDAWQAHKYGPNTLIKDLRDTVRPSVAKAGSAQEAVDRLVNISGIFSYWDFDNNPLPKDIKDVLALGLEAVEPLAAELNRNRLTRSFFPGWDNNLPNIHRTSWIARSLLEHIADGELGHHQPFTSKTVTDWAKAKRQGKVGEWLMSNLTEKTRWGLRVNDLTWTVLQTKHASLMREAMQKYRVVCPNDAQPYRYIFESKLTVQEKFNIAMEGTDRERADGAHYWGPKLRFERVMIDRLLLTTLASTPASYNESFASLPWYVLYSDNLRVWQLFDKVLARSEVAMKIVLLKSMKQPNDGPRRNFALSILAKHFDDPSRIQNVALAKKLDTRTVGQLALQAAAFLNGDAYDDKITRTPEEWSKIRKRIETRIESAP